MHAVQWTVEQEDYVPHMCCMLVDVHVDGFCQSVYLDSLCMQSVSAFLLALVNVCMFSMFHCIRLHDPQFESCLLLYVCMTHDSKWSLMVRSWISY